MHPAIKSCPTTIKSCGEYSWKIVENLPRMMKHMRLTMEAAQLMFARDALGFFHGEVQHK